MVRYNESLSYDVKEDGYDIYFEDIKWTYLIGAKMGKECYEKQAIKMCKNLEDTVNSDNILNLKKYEKINTSKEILQNFLADKTLISDCHSEQGAEYSVSLEKQNLLSNLIKNKEYAELNGLEFKAYWNSKGMVCEEWTLSELQKLSLQIYNFVQPYVKIQQEFEKNIKECTSISEIDKMQFVLQE